MRWGARVPLARLRSRSARGTAGRSTEDLADLLGHFGFRRALREGKLLEEQAARLVEQAPLAERKLLVELEAVHVAKHLGDLAGGPALDHLGVDAETSAPGLH